MVARADLLTELLELPREQREELANVLLDSLDEVEADGEYEPTPGEAAELEQAIHEAQSGGGILASELLRRLTARTAR
jgi:hypothetical protein